jgi:hypothetical protein
MGNREHDILYWQHVTVPVYVQDKGYRLDPRMRILIPSKSKIFPRL